MATETDIDGANERAAFVDIDLEHPRPVFATEVDALLGIHSRATTLDK